MGAAGDRPLVEGVGISHPDRIVYPEPGISKIELARYYQAMGRWIVPHMKGRPLTLVHCPAGLAGECRYMRHSKVWGPTVLRRVRIQEKTKVGEYLVADTLAAVVGLVQMGVVEIHTWNSTADDVERPNRIVWDLDPGPDVGWTQIVEAARAVRDVLAALRLESWVKTTGGRGLHVVVPIVPHRDWSECLAFSRALAEVLVRRDPARYTTKFGKQGREAKILLDYLRNNRTNTSICAFSARARPRAPVSVPVGWEDLGARLRPAELTVTAVRRRFGRRVRDPWAGYWTARQRISAAAMQAIARM